MMKTTIYLLSVALAAFGMVLRQSPYKGDATAPPWPDNGLGMLHCPTVTA